MPGVPPSVAPPVPPGPPVPPPAPTASMVTVPARGAVKVKEPGVEKVWASGRQRPRWQTPCGQAVPSGLFFLHLPFLRRLQGEQCFFFAAAGESDDAPPAAMAAATATRREVTRDWSRQRTWLPSMENSWRDGDSTVLLHMTEHTSVERKCIYQLRVRQTWTEAPLREWFSRLRGGGNCLYQGQVVGDLGLLTCYPTGVCAEWRDLR
jgi:hypothetical protein